MVRTKKWTDKRVRARRDIMLNSKAEECVLRQDNWEANNCKFPLLYFIDWKFKVHISKNEEVVGQSEKGGWLFGAGSGGLEALGRPPTFVCHPYRGQCGTLAVEIQGQKTTVWKNPCSRTVQMLLAWGRNLGPVKQNSCEHRSTLSQSPNSPPPTPVLILNTSCHSQLTTRILLAVKAHCDEAFRFCPSTKSKMKNVEREGNFVRKGILRQDLNMWSQLASNSLGGSPCLGLLNLRSQASATELAQKIGKWG